MNIDKHINDILNGKEDLPKFNQPEHAGVCSAGPLLIGALLVCDFARQSISASGNARDSETKPAKWEIDEAQEQAVQVWAEQKGVWIPEAEEWLKENFGPELAHGAEAKVFCRNGDSYVVKFRTFL